MNGSSSIGAMNFPRFGKPPITNWCNPVPEVESSTYPPYFLMYFAAIGWTSFVSGFTTSSQSISVIRSVIGGRSLGSKIPMPNDSLFAPGGSSRSVCERLKSAQSLAVLKSVCGFSSSGRSPRHSVGYACPSFHGATGRLRPTSSNIHVTQKSRWRIVSG
jgi:hypothetical protein